MKITRSGQPREAKIDWVGDYYIWNLHGTLLDLGACDAEINRMLLWYRENAQEWVQGRASFAEFGAYARARIRTKLGQQVDARSLAMRIIDAMFRDGEDVTLAQVLDAVTRLIPAKSIPFLTEPRGSTMFVDLGDQILKCDKDFFENVLKRLYPFEVRKGQLIKKIPLGEGAEREIDLSDLAFWYKFPNYDKAERRKAKEFHSTDKLDWTPKNLYSRFEEGLLREKGNARINADSSDNRTIPTAAAASGAPVTVPTVRPWHVSPGAKNTYVAENPSLIPWDFALGDPKPAEESAE
ncbi:MAG: hypothetical protein WB799_18265 [Candidatus Sulfotelmatobacter sp.]